MSETVVHAEQGGHGERVGHVVPWWVLFATWFALMALTYLTVAATYIDLGDMNLFLAMLIATVKACLVAFIFMHLAFDRPFNAVILLASLVFVMVFIVLALVDTSQYQPTMIPGYAPDMPQR